MQTSTSNIWHYGAKAPLWSYGYYSGTRGAKWVDGVIFDHLCKHDFETGRTSFHQVSGLATPSEPVFAARPGGKAEDEGWILSYWWDPRRDVSELVILDARDFEGPSVARIKRNNRVPLTVHGNWRPR